MARKGTWWYVHVYELKIVDVSSTRIANFPPNWFLELREFRRNASKILSRFQTCVNYQLYCISGNISRGRILRAALLWEVRISATWCVQSRLSDGENSPRLGGLWKTSIELIRLNCCFEVANWTEVVKPLRIVYKNHFVCFSFIDLMTLMTVQKI